MQFSSPGWRAFAAIAVVALLAPLAMTASASGSPPAQDDHPVLSRSTPAAERALAAVQAAFAHDAGDRARAESASTRDLSILMRDLRVRLSGLSPNDRRVADRYLARPTDGGEPFGANYGSTSRPTNDCVKSPTAASHFCIHWVRRTSDAPPLADADNDGLPNQVEQTRNVMNNVWNKVIVAGGYSAPPADGRGPAGYRARFDVYLADLGEAGVYGYCSPEFTAAGQGATSYCVVDDDFAQGQFPSNTPLGNLQVTGAHEFFHAVQYGYDYREDSFIMENSSTWLEDEIYDGVNDNRNYLGESSLADPAAPLDFNAYWYGNWVWLRFLTETYPDEGGSGLPLLIREMWERSDDGTTYSLQALNAELADRAGELPELLADFATANRRPDTFYEEGAAYPMALLQGTVDLSAGAGPATREVTVDHLASGTVRYRPATGFSGGGWTLTVSVDAPSLPEELQANVTVVGTDGSRSTQDVSLDGTGLGETTVPFSSASVSQVEVTVANGGDDYSGCDGVGAWACGGTPLDNNRVFALSATTSS